MNTTSSTDQVLADWRVVCAPSLGHNLNILSCNNAFAKISRNTAPRTFGFRGTGNWDVLVPYRFLSGMLARSTEGSPLFLSLVHFPGMGIILHDFILIRPNQLLPASTIIAVFAIIEEDLANQPHVPRDE